MTHPEHTLSEHVILLNSHGEPDGVIEKYAAHHQHTPLHLAFSCWIFNPRGQYLVTRRALSKQAWPGVWTNSVCGHPQWEEPFEQAIKRRCQYEVGLTAEQIAPVKADFRYRATDAAGMVENEVCPVFAAVAAGDVNARADEVMDYRWVALPELIAAVQAAPWAFSPWMAQLLDGAPARQALLAFAARLTR